MRGIRSILDQLNEHIVDINSGVYDQSVSNPFGLHWYGYHRYLKSEDSQLLNETYRQQQFVNSLKQQFERATNTPFGDSIKNKMDKLYDHLIELAEKKRDQHTASSDDYTAVENRIKSLKAIQKEFNDNTAGADKEKVNQLVAKMVSYSDLKPYGHNNKNIPVSATVVKGGSESPATQLNQFYLNLNQKKNNFFNQLKTTVHNYEKQFKELEAM